MVVRFLAGERGVKARGVAGVKALGVAGVALPSQEGSSHDYRLEPPISLPMWNTSVGDGGEAPRGRAGTVESSLLDEIAGTNSLSGFPKLAILGIVTRGGPGG